jgi:chromatin remodeling complex protein RSC6
MAEKKASGGARGGIAKPVTPSPELAAIVGAGPLPRSEIVSKMWEHIKKNNLQNPQNKREILADDKLKKVFGKDSVTMFEMNKHISGHVKPA